MLRVLFLLGCLWVFGYAEESWPSDSSISPLDLEKQIVRVVEVHTEVESVKDFVSDLDMEHAIDMTSHSGVGFKCFAISSTDKKTSQDSRPREDDHLIKKLEMLKGNCAVKRLGYWSYKICPFGSVSQIHYEGSNAVTTFELGQYASSERIEEDDVKIIQTFQNGSNGRNSRVHFHCRPRGNVFDVTSVDETSIHSYDIHVSTSVLCDSSPSEQALHLLHGLSGQCFSRNEGWWTYEYCHEKHMRQYHKDADGTMTEFILGKFDVEGNMNLLDSDKVLVKDITSGRPSLEQAYTEGTPCAPMVDHRTTIVKFYCSANYNFEIDVTKTQFSPTTIQSVNESPSCTYVVKIFTSLLCSHPFFSDSIPAQKKTVIKKIHCMKEELAAAIKGDHLKHVPNNEMETTHINEDPEEDPAKLEL